MVSVKLDGTAHMPARPIFGAAAKAVSNVPDWLITCPFSTNVQIVEIFHIYLFIQAKQPKQALLIAPTPE